MSLINAMDGDVSFQNILEAGETLRDISHITPIERHQDLDAAASAKVFLKCEMSQRTGSFKFRGAYNAARSVKAKGIDSDIATISSGNHGQGLALAAKLLGLSAHIIVPKPYMERKFRAIVQHDAHVIPVDDRAAADRALQEILGSGKTCHIHAFNDPLVIAGQGTIMLELLQQVSDLDVVLAPVGGGGLLSGLSIAAHHYNPRLSLYACEPLGAADAAQSLSRNVIVPMLHPRTLADGLRTSLGSRTLPILKQHLTDVFLVTEEEILTAMRFAEEKLHLDIEPSSAVALAPLLRREPALAGCRIGVVLTGGNLDRASFWQSVNHGRRE